MKVITTSKTNSKFQRILFYTYIATLIAGFIDATVTALVLSPDTVYREGQPIARFLFQHFGMFWGWLLILLDLYIYRSVLYYLFRHTIFKKLLFILFIIITIWHIAAAYNWLS